MSTRLDALAARKALLIAQMRLQRMELAIHMGDVREAIRPAGMIGGAIAKPAATIALVEAIAPLFGLQRFAQFFRVASIGFAIFRIARNWRATNE
jgi:hypothetical protein